MDGRRSAWIGLALALATVLAYAGVLGAGFVEYDDDLYVSERPEVLAGLSAEGVRWAFTSVQGANWFPLTRLSWMLDAELHGADPAGYHATSLALHIAAVLALFLALRRLLGSDGPAAAVAAVFALHPLHVESVAWVSARKDVLSGLCFAGVLWFHARRASEASTRRDGLWVFLALAAGLLAKPMLVTAPFVLLLLDYWPLRRLGGEGRIEAARLRAALVEKAPLFALVAVMSGVTFAAQQAGGAVQGFETFPLGVRLETALDALLQYLARYAWPTQLAVFYPHPRGELPFWRPCLGAAVLVGGFALAFALRRRAPQWLVGWAWFVGMLVPVSGLVQVGQAASADRYTYLPAIGLSVALVWSLRGWVASHRGAAVGAWVAGGLVLLALGVATRSQVETWRDGEALFRHAIAVTRDNAVAHTNLALVLARSERSDEALRHLDTALAIRPASAIARGLRGELRVLTAPPLAAEDFRVAAALEPSVARWQRGLGRALADRDPAAAEASFRVALDLDASDPQAHVFLAALLQRQGHLEAAAQHYASALRDAPRLSRAIGESGVARAQGQHAELLGRLGRPREAAASYARALAGGERSVLLLNNYAWLLATAGPELRDPERAVALAREAVSASGAAPGTLDTLAAALIAAGEPDEALAAARRALVAAARAGDEELVRSLRERFPELRPKSSRVEAP